MHETLHIEGKLPTFDLPPMMNTESVFTAEGKGSTVMSPPVKKPVGVFLHPYVYSLRNMDYYDSSPPTQIVGMPDIEGYAHCKEHIGSGYIYVYNPNDSFYKMKEYQVIGGTVVEISLVGTHSHERRHPRQTDDWLAYIPIPRGETVSIAFSRFQWSLNYIDSMIKDSTLRRKRFQLYSAKQAEENEHVSSLNDISVFFRSRLNFYEKMKTTSPNAQVNYYSCQYYSQSRSSYEIKEYKKLPSNREPGKGTKKAYPLFMSFYDPIGSVESICFDYEKCIDELRAMITAVQTGKHLDTVKRKMQDIYEYDGLPIDEKEKQAENKADTTKEEEASNLFNISLTLYQFLFGNESKDLKKYRDTQKKHAIEKVLAVQERIPIRQKMEQLRNALGNLMNTNFYQNIMLDVVNLVEDHKILAYECLSRHYNLLAIRHHDIDRGLDLPKNRKQTDDPWADFLEKSFEEKGDVLIWKDLTDTDVLIKSGTFFDTEIDPEKMTKLDDVVEDLVYKAASAASALVDAFTKNVKTPAQMTLLANRVNMLTLGKHAMNKAQRAAVASGTLKKDVTYFSVSQGYFREMYKQAVNQNGGKYTSNDFHNLANDGTVAKSKSGGKNVVLIENTVDTPVTYIDNKTITVSFGPNLTKSQQWAMKMQSNPAFIKTCRLIALANFAWGINSMTKDTNARNTINLISASAEMLSIAMAIRASQLAAQGAGASGLMMAARITGVVGAGLTVVVSAMDTLERYNARDYDSMFFNGVATALGVGMLSLVVYTEFFATAAIASTMAWPLIIVAILLIVVLVLAYLTMDDPFETFLKKGVFGRRYEWLGLSEVREIIKDDPWVYVRDLVDKRSTRVDADAHAWASYKKAWNYLQDLLMGYAVEHEAKESKDLTEWYQMRSYFMLSFSMKATFFNFKSNISYLKHHCFLYIHGLGGAEIELMPQESATQGKNYVAESKVNGEEIVFTYKIPEDKIEQLNFNSCILFCSQFVVDENRSEIFPRQEGEDRYQGYYFALSNGERNAQHDTMKAALSSDSYNSTGGFSPALNSSLMVMAYRLKLIRTADTKVGTLQKLKDGTTWAKNLR